MASCIDSTRSTASGGHRTRNNGSNNAYGLRSETADRLARRSEQKIEIKISAELRVALDAPPGQCEERE